MLEFALVLPFVLVLVLGMLELGKAMHYRNDLTHLANEAARYAAVNKNPGPEPSLEASIKSQATSDELENGGTPGEQGTTQGPLEVFICFPDGDTEYQAGDPVRVIVRSEYKWLNILGITATKELVGTSTMRIEKDWTNTAYSMPVALACP
jgi:hypothetical protein